MCGKFTQQASWAEVVAFSAPLTIDPDAEQVINTPMRLANVLRLDDKGAPVAAPMRWGFADKNAKNPSRPKHMHARAETVETLPTFAHAFAHDRGLLFVSTFNVGEELPNGKVRQWTITPKDGRAIAIAVIGEEWRNETEKLWTYVMVSTPANALIAPLTDRMPAILAPAHWRTWLEGSPEEAKAVLATFEPNGAWSIAPQTASKPPPAQQDLF